MDKAFYTFKKFGIALLEIEILFPNLAKIV
jgi:hypothetical protein